MSFVEVGGNNPIFQFYDGKSGKVVNKELVGTLRAMRDISVKGRPATLADIEISPGKQVSIWVPAVLKRKLEGCTTGDFIKIAYLGKVLDTPRGKAHDWKLEVRR